MTELEIKQKAHDLAEAARQAYIKGALDNAKSDAQFQGTSPCLNPVEESEYNFSEPRNVRVKINYANKGDHETFAEHYGCLPDQPQEPTPVIVGAASDESLSDILAIGKGYEAGVYNTKNKILRWALEHREAIEANGDEDDAFERGEYSILNALIDMIRRTFN